MAVFVQVPEVATNVVFRVAADGGSDLVVTGPRTRGRYHPVRVPLTCVRVPVRPSRVRAALGVSPELLVDRAIRLTDLWGSAAADLAAELAALAPSQWVDVDRDLAGLAPPALPPVDGPAAERVAAV